MSESSENQTRLSTLPPLKAVPKTEESKTNATTMTSKEAVFTHKLVDLVKSHQEASEIIGYDRSGINFAFTQDKVTLRMETACRLAYENLTVKLKQSKRFFVIEVTDEMAEVIKPWIENEKGLIREIDVIAAESE